MNGEPFSNARSAPSPTEAEIMDPTADVDGTSRLRKYMAGGATSWINMERHVFRNNGEDEILRSFPELSKLEGTH